MKSVGIERGVLCVVNKLEKINPMVLFLPSSLGQTRVINCDLTCRPQTNEILKMAKMANGLSCGVSHTCSY